MEILVAAIGAAVGYGTRILHLYVRRLRAPLSLLERMSCVDDIAGEGL